MAGRVEAQLLAIHEVGFFGAVWAASGAMTSVIKAVNRAYERPETRLGVDPGQAAMLVEATWPTVNRLFITCGSCTSMSYVPGSRWVTGLPDASRSEMLK